MKKIIIYTMLFVAMANSVLAQISSFKPVDKNPSKAWEFGLGGSVFQFNRTSFSNFSQLETGYVFDLKLEQALFGGNLYVARELNDHFYLDLQGTVGTTGSRSNDYNKNKWLYMAGLGLQWRLGEYFGSKHIDPYLRAGINYMHKEFNILYAGTEGLDDQQMKWILNNIYNKEGADRTDLMPVSLGAGLNLWLNDRWGIGIQGDYLLMPYNNVANSLQGTVRVMYRLGGESKKTQPTIQYVDRIVEKRVEVPVPAEPVAPVETEKTAENPVTIIKEVEKILTLENVYFAFDKADLKPESNKTLDEVAEVLKHDTLKRYLITGYTDSQGSADYNLKLSTRRAEAVMVALIKRGVPSFMLKARGVGSKIAYAKPSEPDEIRYGDRKMTIEPISNRMYWDYLPETSFY